MTIIMNRANTTRLALTFVTTFSLLITGSGCSSPKPVPRLAVVITVDMLPASFLTRFGGRFGDGGFNRLKREGAWFTNAHFSYGATETGPGHATIATGANPSDHGIIANYWYKPDPIGAIECSRDEDVALVGVENATAAGSSPRWLEASTVGDELKRRHADARVWSLAIKPRAAVLSGGHSADGAIWWSTSTGDYVSSTKYFTQLPAWCQSLNDEGYADTFFHAIWDRVLPEAAYASCGVDDATYETGSQVFWTNVMPKVLGKILPESNKVYYNQLAVSPFGNELVFELARRAMIHESLGIDDTPDLLFISLSSNDMCGHKFGPDSHEMLDMTVRTDRQLASWLEFLDERVGLNHCLIVLTSDHGVSPSPERAQNDGLGGGRIKLHELFGRLDDALTESLGTAPNDAYYITAVDPPWVYLNEPLLKGMNVDIKDAAAVVAEFARSCDGIEDAIAVATVKERLPATLTPLERAVRNNVFDGRSGHVYLHLKRYWHRTGECCGHGTAHNYDTHVPVIFMGDAFRKGEYHERIDVRDLAVTLSAALDIPSPSAATGRVLREALAR